MIRYVVLLATTSVVLENGRPYDRPITISMPLVVHDWTDDPDDERELRLTLRVTASRCEESVDLVLSVPYRALGVADRIIQTELPPCILRERRSIIEVGSQTIVRKQLSLKSPVARGEVLTIA